MASLSGVSLSFVGSYKYIGFTMSPTLSDELHVKALSRSLCCRANLLIQYSVEKDLAYCFVYSVFPTGPGCEYRNRDSSFITGTRGWHRMRSKGAKAEKLISHFQSNGSNASFEVIAEVNETDFFGIFADETPSASHVECLAVGVRYIDGEGATKERLLVTVDYDPELGTNLGYERYLSVVLVDISLRIDKKFFKILELLGQRYYSVHTHLCLRKIRHI
ncbi:hypothetical protein QYM36_012622 [Artemia franciscana]|uniref:Uncharacterized protein n=1 Tax=Artemia franciscana TaxID=6661 RepID=A0AA88L399_ARTSF|nr:hypothetical protein QYM36_012622 [Artemia franciscana]